MTVIVRPKHIQAFTLVETMVALIISGAVFVGLFSILATLDNKFEVEVVRGELVTYCNYVLDDIAQNIRLSDQVESNNDEFIISLNKEPLHTYSLSKEEGVLKDGIPIHEEVQNHPKNTDGGTAKHKIFYVSKKKNGFIKYILEELEIENLANIDDNLLYDTTDGNLRLSSFVIKLHAKLIMGWDEEVYKRLNFERIVFSSAKYFILTGKNQS